MQRSLKEAEIAKQKLSKQIIDLRAEMSDLRQYCDLVEEKNAELQLKVEDLKKYPRQEGDFVLVNYPEAKIEQLNFSTEIQ